MKSSITTKAPRYTPAAVQLALEELEVDAKFGPQEAIAYCCFSKHDRPHLYINLGDKPGVYHCFRCDAAGSFETFVQAYTGWGQVKTIMACRAWQRRVANEPRPEREPAAQPAPTADRLAAYSFRHPYVYDRGLVESTAQRYSLGYDKRENAITIPWFAQNGTLLAIKRRMILSRYYIFDEGGALVGTTLFGLNHVKQNAYVWLTEGEFDCMYLDQCFRIAHLDRHYAVSPGGKYLQETQIIALCRKSPHRVVLMFDNDDAGREAQQEVKRRLLPRVRIVEALYPSDSIKDPNAMLFEQVVHAARALEKES